MDSKTHRPVVGRKRAVCGVAAGIRSDNPLEITCISCIVGAADASRPRKLSAETKAKLKEYLRRTRKYVSSGEDRE